MTLLQRIITTAMLGIGTALTRFLPFVMFPQGKQTPPFIVYLGEVLPGAVFAMLIVYCFKGVSFAAAPFGAPEILAVAFICLIHKWKHHMLLSVAGGTFFYMFLVQVIF